jgi:hypothetical protein
MEEFSPFKRSGDIQIAIPLTEGFETVLRDLLEITAMKNGFAAEASQQIAAKVCTRLFSIQAGAPANSDLKAQLFLLHRPGQLQIKTEVPLLHLSTVESFSV